MTITIEEKPKKDSPIPEFLETMIKEAKRVKSPEKFRQYVSGMIKPSKDPDEIAALKKYIEDSKHEQQKATAKKKGT